MEHLKTEVGGIANHMTRSFFVHCRPAAPAVIHGKWVMGILPGILVGEHLTNPAPKNIRSCVGPTIRCTKKYSGRFKDFARLQPGTKLTCIRIKADFAVKRFAIASQRQMSPAAELDAYIPSSLHSVGVFDQEVWDNFARFSMTWQSIW